MNYHFITNFRSNLLIFSVLFAFVAAFFILPDSFRSEAGNDTTREGLINRTESHGDGLENYDIRSDKKDAAVSFLLQARQNLGQTASAVADKRDDFVRGEERLREKVPTLKIEYNDNISIPEVISPDVKKGAAFLSRKSNLKRSEILRNFVKDNNQLVGIDNNQSDKLVVTADYENPSGNMSFAHLEQRINDIPVFRGEVKAGFTKDGEIIRVINNLAPGLDYQNLSNDFRNPIDAVKAAAEYINYELKPGELIPNESASDDLKIIFGTNELANRAEKMYFPTEPGVALPAWRVIIWQPVNAYMMLVDAETGTLLWRKNITEDQTQAATYQVYNNTNAFMQVAESPAPLTPGPINPGTGTQGNLLTRENVTLIGNEGSLSFNNKGWIDDGSNTTAGNNTLAGVDLVAPDGVDAPVTGANRVFSSAWNPPPGNPAPGASLNTQASQDGAVIQMFYTVNRYHDALYKLGFTEAAFNFQNDNFGRGGVGNDRISSEGQDFTGNDNANFSTPPDGIRGRMQMYKFFGPNPDRDGTADVDIIVHELTHGTSNRLHGNSSGLTSNMSRGMGEGWSDWYAHTLTAEPSDPINGIYTTGGYVLITPTDTRNFYYGIRRFPKAVMSFTGGANNRPHNPLTFNDINQGCSISDGAFSPAFGGTCDQVHNAGEIWSSALWEVRALMVQRLGFQTGTQRVLQIVTDAMKISPISPTFLQGRDAILVAARANANSTDVSADIRDIWEGFRIRGMGFNAKVNATSPANVTEAFDQPNVVIPETGFVVSDVPGDNDGFPEPGETLTLSVPVYNNTGQSINNIAVNIDGGANVSYGNITDGGTVTKQFSFTVPNIIPCGGAITLNLNIAGSAGARTESRVIIIGVPDAPESEVFDGVTAPTLPAGWTSSQTGPGLAFTTQTGNSDSAPNSAFTPNRGVSGGNSGATLDSAVYTINAEAGVLSFRNNYNTESGWDGGVLEISINGGAFQDIIAAGGRFVEGGYNGSLGANSNPLDGRTAWTGNSGGYITTKVQIPASANGQPVKFRWRFGEDTNTSEVGWHVDTVKVTKGYTCGFGGNPPSNKARFDYDGDGKTDISIFRPNLGQWWYMRSSDNNARAFEFGSSSDRMVPADFTGDGKTDIAFWRPSTGEWFVLRSEDNSFFAFPFGTNGDIPAPGDFDGDGKADPAIFRPSNTTWFILNSGGGTTIQQFGINGDVPIVEDYDGDNKDDIAVFRPSASEWYFQRSSNNQVFGYQFGSNGDKPVPADYTGDGKSEIAVYRQSTGEWLVQRSEDNSFYAFTFGTAGDVPVPGDYDGDGKADATVFRPSNRTWFKLQTTNGFEAIAFGIEGDIPTPSAFTP